MAEHQTYNSNEQSTPLTPEARLLRDLSRLKDNAAGYFSIQIKLSELTAANKQSHFLKIAHLAFDRLLETHQATLYTLTSLDLVLICHNLPVDEVDIVVDKVRGLFSEDPLMAEEDNALEDRFSVWFDLSNVEDFASFYDIASNIENIAQQRLKQKEREKRELDKKGIPLGPKNVASIKNKLKNIKLTSMVHQQICLKLGAGNSADIVFRENYVSMADLREKIAPDVNLFASIWLFQYLTESLDRRVLDIFEHYNFADLKEPVSINLNISTILSRDFQQFNKVVGDHASKVIIEIQMVDIFADMKNYYYARDALHQRGYQVTVDGIKPQAFQYFDPSAFGSDFIKINWGPELEGKESEARIEEMKEIIRHAGKESIILARVDNENAIKWGLTMGITRFQGFYIDKIVKAFIAGNK